MLPFRVNGANPGTAQVLRDAFHRGHAKAWRHAFVAALAQTSDLGLQRIPIPVASLRILAATSGSGVLYFVLSLALSLKA